MRSDPKCSSITSMSNTYKITSKGQVTIPLEIREQLHLLPHTEVEFDLKNGVAIIRKAATKSGRSTSRGAEMLRAIRGKATVKMTTDQILALTRK